MPPFRGKLLVISITRVLLLLSLYSTVLLTPDHQLPLSEMGKEAVQIDLVFT